MNWKRWLKRAALTGLNLLLIAALIVTGTLRGAPTHRAYASTNGLVPIDSLLYEIKLANLVVRDARDAVVLESNGEFPSVSSALSGIRSGQVAIDQATVEGSARATIALTKSETEVVTGAAVSYQVPLLGMTGTLTESTPGIYTASLTDKLVITPDFTGLDQAAVRGWQIRPIDYSLNARKVGTTAVTDQVSGLGITESVDATVELPFTLYLKARLTDGDGNPVAGKTLSAQVAAPNHTYTETVTLKTDAQGLFTYQRREVVVVTAAGGTIRQLGAPIQFGDGSPTVLAFWWSGDDDWWDWDWISGLFGSPEDAEGEAGDPVNVVTGNVFDSTQDLYIPGRGLPVQFARFYNSQDDYDGPLGYGWTFSYNSFLTENSDGSVTEQDPQGARVRFTPDETGAYVAPAGNHDTLVRAADGSWRLTKKNGILWQYGADGRLTRISEPNGNALTLAYEGGRLARLVDTVGRTVSLAYDGSGRISSLTDPAGRTVAYGYDASGNLVSVTDPLGKSTGYAYDSAHNLTTITRPNGFQTHFTYDDRDRAASSYGDGDAHKIELSYNKADQKSLVRDSLGNETTYYYNDAGQITRIVDPLGNAMQYTWSADGNKIAATDQLRRTSRLSYDALGNVITVTPPDGRVSRMTYTDRFSRLATITEPDGSQTRYEYDEAGNLSGSVDALGNTNRFTYDGTGQLVAITDALGQTTRFDYDAYGNVTAIVDAAGNTTRFEYDRLGQVTATRDGLGRVTRFEYDAGGRTTLVLKPDGSTVRMAYDALGNLTAVTDENGNTSRTEYDGLGRPTAAIDPLGNATRYQYNTEGKATAITDPLGRTTQFQYDALTRLTAIRYPDGSSESYGYDAVGNRVLITDENGNSTTYRYDARNRISGVTDALGGSVSILYNDAGQIRQVTNPNGKATLFAYDGLNRLARLTDPLGNVTAYAYDPLGRRVERTDPAGQVTRWSYDAVGNLLSSRYADGATVAYQYDAAGNLVQMTDSTGTYSFGYDALDRLVEELLPDNRRLQHQYDAAGNRIALVDPQGGVTRFDYDPADRMVAVTDRAGKSTRYTYDALDQTTRITYPSGAGIGYAYDALGRLAEVTNFGAAGQVLKQARYSFDRAGNPLAVTDEQGQTARFTYDALNRLLSESYADGRTLAYTYDAAGNRTSRTDGTGRTDYLYDSAGRIVQAGSTLYTHDPNGNMTSRSEGGETTAFVYDAAGFMVQAGPVSYTYDGLGRLTSTTGPAAPVAAGNARAGGGGSTTTTYTYDGDQVLEESSRLGSYHFTRGAGGQLIARTPVRQENGAGGQYFHLDGAGNVVALTGENGNLLGEYGYDAFGNMLAKPRNPMLDSFTFAGNAYEMRTGLYNFHARWYDPALGRFLTRDPVPGFAVMPQTLNLYVYGVNNPLTYVDPQGDFPPLLAAILISLAINAAISSLDYYLSHAGDKGDFDWSDFGMTVGKDTAMGFGIDMATLGLGKVLAMAKGGVLAAKLAKWANARKMARIRAIGAAGEKAVGITGKKEAISSITNTARRRIPDALDHPAKILKEVKNVKKVRWTKQLEDFLLWSKQKGYTFELYVRKGAELAPEIQRLKNTGEIIVKDIP